MEHLGHMAINDFRASKQSMHCAYNINYITITVFHREEFIGSFWEGVVSQEWITDYQQEQLIQMVDRTTNLSKVYTPVAKYVGGKEKLVHYHRHFRNLHYCF